MLNDRIHADIAFDFGAAALDQGAVFFKRFNQLQNAADIVNRGLT